MLPVGSDHSVFDPLDHAHWSFSNYQLIPVSRSQTAVFGMLHTLCVRYLSGTSSSPSSFRPSGSDPGPLVDLSRGVFHSRLKTFFPKAFHPVAIYPSQADLSEFYRSLLWQSLVT